MAVELLAKFRHFVPLDAIAEWTQGTANSWSSTIIQNYINGFRHVAQNITGTHTIKKDLLNINKTYVVRFMLDFDNPLGQTNFVRVACGTSYSSYLSTGGEKEVILTCATNPYFLLESDANCSCNIYNITIEDISYTSLDLFENEDILLNISVKEVKEYGQSTDTYSRTFKLPGTPTNNQFFKYVFSVNEDSTYDFNQFSKAAIVVDGLTIKTGILRLDNIIKVGNFCNYEMTFYGEIIGLFADLGDTLLEEIDYSDINHYATASKVASTWYAFNKGLGEAYDNYVYPYICYGDIPFTGIRGKSTENKGQGLMVSDLFPAISLRKLIKKVLDFKGYTYTSQFIDSSQFKSIIVPFTNEEEKLNQWWQCVKVTLPAGYNQINVNEIGYGSNCKDSNKNCQSDYSTGKFIARDSGQEEVGAAWDGIASPKFYSDPGFRYCLFNLDYPRNSYYDDFDHLCLFNYHYQYDMYNATNTNAAAPGQYMVGNIPGTFQCRKKGRYKLEMDISMDHYQEYGLGDLKVFATRIPKSQISWINPGGTSLLTSYWCNSETTEYVTSINSEFTRQTISHEMDCEKDDLIALKFVYRNVHQQGVSWTEWYGRVFEIRVYEYGYGNGAYVDFKNVVPEGVKATEFVSDVLKMFNLYVRTETDNPKNLIIEPYQTFYESGLTWDLTTKVDLSQEIKITAPKDYSAKNIILKYKEGDDTWNNYYKEKIDINTYGSKRLYINDYNQEDEKVIQLKTIAPTVLRNYGWDADKNIYVYSDISSYTYPSNKAIDYTHNTKTTPRILYFNNLINNSSTTERVFRFEGTFDMNYGIDYFPYAGHVLNPFTMENTYDLNFDTLLENNSGKRALMFDGVPGKYKSPYLPYITKNNLYNVYWSDYINNYIDRNARLVELYAYLTPFDIQNIQMSDIIQIEETKYYINTISDYNCSKRGLTKLELVKINRIKPFTTYEVVDVIAEAPNVTDRDQGILIGLSNTSVGNSIVIGSGNNVDAKSLIIGNNNITDENTIVLLSDEITTSPDNIIMNSHHVIIPSSSITHNTVINEEHITIYDSDTTFINGVKIKDGKITKTMEVLDGGLNITFDPYMYLDYHVFTGGLNEGDVSDDRGEIYDAGLN